MLQGCLAFKQASSKWLYFDVPLPLMCDSVATCLCQVTNHADAPVSFTSCSNTDLQHTRQATVYWGFCKGLAIWHLMSV